MIRTILVLERVARRRDWRQGVWTLCQVRSEAIVVQLSDVVYHGGLLCVLC